MDKLCLLDVANKFVGRNENQKEISTSLRELVLIFNVIVLSRCFYQKFLQERLFCSLCLKQCLEEAQVC